MTTDQVALFFLIISTFLVITLIKGVITLINHNWDKEPFNAATLFKIFKWPLLGFIALCLFVAFAMV